LRSYSVIGPHDLNFFTGDEYGDVTGLSTATGLATLIAAANLIKYLITIDAIITFVPTL